MRNLSSSAVSFSFAALEAAWLETRKDLAVQASTYAISAARAAEIESADEEIYQPFFSDEERTRARRSQRKAKATYRPWQR